MRIVSLAAGKNPHRTLPPCLSVFAAWDFGIGNYFKRDDKGTHASVVSRYTSRELLGVT
jgi:hypothetical protein